MEALEEAWEDSKCDIVHQLLCMACLGPGQTLHVLKDEALELYNLSVNSGQQLIHNVSPRVCWECEILLKKVIHFRERVTECHEIFNRSHVMWSKVTRPSRLRIFTTAQINIPPIDPENSRSEVKQEIEQMKHLEPSETEDTQPCIACLCGGRWLNNIRDKELKYYMDILNQKMVAHDVSAVSRRLCWECRSMLRQATRFSEQSVESYQTLLPSLLTADIQAVTSLLCSGVSLPPRLCRSVRDRVDIPPHAHTHSRPPPVKLEPGSLWYGISSTPPAVYVQCPDEPAAEVKQTSRRDAAHVTTSNITCDRCHRQFTSKQQLIRHIAGNIYPQNTNVCDDNSYVCVESALKDPRRLRQSAQVTSHAADNPYQCNECSKTYRYKSQMIYHIRTHTGEKPYGCSQCSKAFFLIQHLRRHIRTHSGYRPYQCSQCSKAYFRKQHLVDHTTTHTKEKPYHCNQCTKAYTRKQHLVNHMRIHTAEKTYQCSQCSKLYTQKHDLARHTKTHSGERPYQCSQCSKAFTRKNHLVDHTTTHTKEKPYHCNQCTKAYTRKQHLVNHMRIHTAEKTYQCSQCSKLYTQKHDLARHTKTHSGERPYQCSQCSKAFTRNQYLAQHSRTHSGERPYQCSQCSKAFLRKHDLAQHILTHTGKMIYMCAFTHCPKKFSVRSSLYRHMKTHTREQL